MKRINTNAWGALALAATISIAATDSAAQEKANPDPDAGPRRSAPAGASQRPEVKVTASGVATNATGEVISWRNVDPARVAVGAKNKSMQPALLPAQTTQPYPSPIAGPVNKVATKRKVEAEPKVARLPQRHSMEATQGVTGNLYFKELDGKRVYWMTNSEALTPPLSERLKNRVIPQERLAPVTKPEVKP